MTSRSGRTQVCGRPQATARLAHARKFLDAADLIATDIDADEANASVAASLAVLAGIAAADAACCARLGRRSRSQDHHCPGPGSPDTFVVNGVIMSGVPGG